MCVCVCGLVDSAVCLITIFDSSSVGLSCRIKWVEAFRDEAQGQWLRPDEHRPMQSSDFDVNKFIIQLETQNKTVGKVKRKNPVPYTWRLLKVKYDSSMQTNGSAWASGGLLKSPT